MRSSEPPFKITFINTTEATRAMKMIARVFLLLGFGACLIGAGQAGAAEVVKAYTTMEEPLTKTLFDEFEKQTGIKVEWIRLSGGETVTRIEARRFLRTLRSWLL
jgi:ABC-type glycerol-3-phosphate transport system substrate-binding protein